MLFKLQQINYLFIRLILLILCKFFFKFKAIGLENIPKNTAVILAPNHASYFDPIFSGVGFPGSLSYMARDSLFKKFIFGNIIRVYNAFPIKRGAIDRSAIRMAAERLNKGLSVLVFPEGTRSKDGKLGEAKPGLGLIALNTDKPIVPAYIKGSFDVWPKGAKMIKFRKVSIYFGKPIYVKDIKFDEHASFSDKCRKLSEIVMEGIQNLC